MVRGRGKGKKQFALAAGEDLVSGEEEKVHAKKRGRLVKVSKNENQEEDDAKKVEEEDDSEKRNGVLSDQSVKLQMNREIGKKRRRPSHKDSSETVKEIIGLEIKINSSDSVKPVGFRRNGSRRKNKPRWAAEVGVKCK